MRSEQRRKKASLSVYRNVMTHSGRQFTMLSASYTQPQRLLTILLNQFIFFCNGIWTLCIFKYNSLVSLTTFFCYSRKPKATLYASQCSGPLNYSWNVWLFNLLTKAYKLLEYVKPGQLRCYCVRHSGKKRMEYSLGVRYWTTHSINMITDCNLIISDPETVVIEL